MTTSKEQIASWKGIMVVRPSIIMDYAFANLTEKACYQGKLVGLQLIQGDIWTIYLILVNPDFSIYHLQISPKSTIKKKVATATRLLTGRNL